MKSILDLTRINVAFPFVGRAAERSMIGSLNFTIANLVASDIRRRSAGVPVEESPVDLSPLMQKYGNTLDHRNEVDEAARGAAHEDRMREEQGFIVLANPLELAGQLKVVRDYLAEDLDEHAGMLRNPMDPKGGMYKDPYHIAPSLRDSLVRQLSLQPRVNEAHATAQAEALGLDPADIIRIQRRQQEVGLRFLKDHREEMLAILDELGARDSEGNAYTTADAVDVEAKLPAIHRARLFVNADKGLWFERDRTIQMMLRGHPDGKGNLGLVDGAREEIHALFNVFMKDGNIRHEIDEAVRRGATWPTLLDLPKKVSQLVVNQK